MTVATFPALGYDPAPGSAEAIRALAADCRQVADRLAAEAHTLTGVGHTSWTGTAALAFAGQLDTLPGDLRTAAHSFTLTARAIDGYASQLADAQLAARRAEALADTALRRRTAAQAAVESATDPAAAEAARRRLTDADRELATARSRARQATDQARTAARQAAAAVRDASRWAPRKPHKNLLQRLGGAIADGWNKVTDAVHDWVTEHAELLRNISAGLSALSGIASTLALAVCWVPVVGQGAAGALGTFAAVTGGAATATNALLAANGEGSWTSVGVDLGLTVLGGAAKAASKAVQIRRAAKIPTRNLKDLDPATRRALLEQKWEENAERQLRRMEAENPGAHFVERHGQQTTIAQQRRRAANGTMPNGATHRPNGERYAASDASRFYSNRQQLHTMMQAQKFHQLNGINKIELVMPLEVGEGFLKHSSNLRQTKNAHVIFRNGKPYTAYPWLHEAGALAFEGVF